MEHRLICEASRWIGLRAGGFWAAEQSSCKTKRALHTQQGGPRPFVLGASTGGSGWQIAGGGVKTPVMVLVPALVPAGSASAT